jgi:hypothetical protein
MVHIKFTAHTKTLVVSSEFESIASDKTLDISTQSKEASTEQREESLADQQREASTKAGSSHGVESVRESQSGDSGDSETASDNSGRLKVVAAVALAGISYDFGLSNIMNTHVESMESYARYFPKGYGRPPGVESVPEPRANEVVVF